MISNKKHKVAIKFRRRRYWLINAILFYALQLNIFRNDRLWLYGCWEGLRYDDNSRHLFEYMNHNHDNICSVWISTDADIVRHICKLGYTAYLNRSIKGICAQLRAGVCFYTNGLDDFGAVPLVHGATIVGLWHGTGMKNTYYQTCENESKGKIKTIVKKIKDKIYVDSYQDYIISTSAMVSRMRCETYGISPEKVLITGQPRNDVFRKKVRPSEVFITMNYPDEYRYILYMPTYREYENDVVENFVDEISRNKRFVQFLNHNKIRFILKLHFLTKITKRDVKPPFYILSNEDITGVQELLAVADCLITDFSGCCIDFALREKPVILYAPDYEIYSKSPGIKKEWEDIYRNMNLTTVDEVVMKCIKNINGEEDKRIVEFINSMYESQQIKGSLYSENVYQAVADRVAIN